MLSVEYELNRSAIYIPGPLLFQFLTNIIKCP